MLEQARKICAALIRMVLARRLMAGLCFAAVLVGCAHDRRTKEIRGVEYEIRKVELYGVERFKKEEFVEHLHLRESPRVLRHLPKIYWSEAFIPVDRRRIEELYASYGYYEAKVLEIRPQFNEKRKTVTVHITVDEGRPVLIRAIEFQWPEGPARRPPGEKLDRRATPEKIESKAKLRLGDRLEAEALEQTATDLRIALQDRGYPLAAVEPLARVDRQQKRAELNFTLTPGPFARIGSIEIRGLVAVPADLVHDEVKWAVGKPYSPLRLRQIEQAVYAMEVFSSVSVRLDPEDPAEMVDHRIGVIIEVAESKPQYVKVGGGLGLDPNRWEQLLFFQYRHNNLGGRLWRFNGKVTAGYAELPAVYNPEEHGPVVVVEPSFLKKGLLERGLVWTLAPKFELGINQGYQFYSPNNRLGVSRFFTRYVEAGISHNLRFVDFFNTSPDLLASQTLLELDFRDPYLLSYFEFQLTFWIVDRIVQPRNGVVLDTAYDISSHYIGSQFDYNKITPQLRAYWQVHERVQLAWRASVGFIFPFGRNPGAPIDMRYYLGGAETVRGWGLRRLSPQTRNCELFNCGGVPIGGMTSVLGNFETRVRVWKKLYTVAFFDMGDVQPGRVQIKPGEWNYSMGPGLRYASPIGTFRLDVGFRLNRPQRFAHEPIWALHFGLGEAF